MAAWDFRPASAQGLDIVVEYLRAVAGNYAWSALYRGHANASWTAVASAYRPDSAGITRPDQLHAWRSMAQRFAPAPMSSELAYLVLAQHYGIATGLLDWSTNPLIALFFASQPHESKADGQVIVVDQHSFFRIENVDSVGVFKRDRAQPLLIDAAAMNVRSAAQDSVMTLHLKNEAPLATTPIFQVQNEQKYSVREALAIFGLSDERVYADLGTAAENFKQHLVDEEEFLSSADPHAGDDF